MGKERFSKLYKFVISQETQRNAAPQPQNTGVPPVAASKGKPVTAPEGVTFLEDAPKPGTDMSDIRRRLSDRPRRLDGTRRCDSPVLIKLLKEIRRLNNA